MILFTKKTFAKVCPIFCHVYYAYTVSSINIWIPINQYPNSKIWPKLCRALAPYAHMWLIVADLISLIELCSFVYFSYFWNIAVVHILTIGNHKLTSTLEQIGMTSWWFSGNNSKMNLNMSIIKIAFYTSVSWQTSLDM